MARWLLSSNRHKSTELYEGEDVTNVPTDQLSDATTDGVVVASAVWTEAHTLVGLPFRSSWLRLDSERLTDFDRASLIDQNEHALAGIYPEGLIEGFHQLALLDHLVNQVCFIDDPRWSGWNYGFDYVRFTNVVTVANRIRVRGDVVSVQPRGDALLVELSCSIEVEGHTKPCCVANWKVMWVLAD